MRWWPLDPECWEWVTSDETWNDGEGTITHNYLQQHEEGFDLEAVPTPLEEAGTTDPWDISE